MIENHGLRGSGRTTQQIKTAPEGVVFIWVNHNSLFYAKNLARRLNRNDLEIVSPDWLSSYRWAGRYYTAIILDHALRLIPDQFEVYRQVVGNIRKPQHAE